MIDLVKKQIQIQIQFVWEGLQLMHQGDAYAISPQNRTRLASA